MLAFTGSYVSEDYSKLYHKNAECAGAESYCESGRISGKKDLVNE
jgi:hypothetical protein